MVATHALSPQQPALHVGADGQEIASITSAGAFEKKMAPEAAATGDKPKKIMRAMDADAEGEHDKTESEHHHDEDAHNHELVQVDSEFLPALGMSNPADIAYRAMDMLMGIASIIP